MWHETILSFEDRIASLFQPDPLLPGQYLQTFQRGTYLQPEKDLMMAVLEDAILCFQKHFLARDRKGQALFREAEEWIFSEVEHDWLFAFENVCETLGLDPGYLRGALTKMKKRKSIRPRKPKPRDSRGRKKIDRERALRAAA